MTTRHGTARVNVGTFAGTDVLHISRHGAGHARLSSAVDHRANIAALRELEADAIVAVTVCGTLDPEMALGTLVVFDDLHFPANRLGDGSLCTLWDEPGEPGRGHWVFEDPFSAPLRNAAAHRGRADRQPGARRRLLRPRRRPPLQHEDGDRPDPCRRRDVRLADRRTRDGARGRGRDPVRTARLRDRLRQRHQARRPDPGRRTRPPRRRELRHVRDRPRRRDPTDRRRRTHRRRSAATSASTELRGGGALGVAVCPPAAQVLDDPPRHAELRRDLALRHPLADQPQRLARPVVVERSAHRRHGRLPGGSGTPAARTHLRIALPDTP